MYDCNKNTCLQKHTPKALLAELPECEMHIVNENLGQFEKYT